MKTENNCLLLFFMLLIPFALGVWCSEDNIWYGLGGFVGGQLFSYLKDKQEELKGRQ